MSFSMSLMLRTPLAWRCPVKMERKDSMVGVREAGLAVLLLQSGSVGARPGSAGVVPRTDSGDVALEDALAAAASEEGTRCCSAAAAAAVPQAAAAAVPQAPTGAVAVAAPRALGLPSPSQSTEVPVEQELFLEAADIFGVNESAVWLHTTAPAAPPPPAGSAQSRCGDAAAAPRPRASACADADSPLSPLVHSSSGRSAEALQDAEAPEDAEALRVVAP